MFVYVCVRLWSFIFLTSLCVSVCVCGHLFFKPVCVRPCVSVANYFFNQFVCVRVRLWLITFNPFYNSAKILFASSAPEKF